MTLTTTVGGVWTLQALLGVETMPAALRIKPYVPSVHESLIVETTAGPLPLSQTAEYAGLVAAGAIDAKGHVDDVIRDWMMVLGRPDRQVVLAIRRPGEPVVVDDAQPTVYERVQVVCRHKRWMARAARDGFDAGFANQMVIEAVGEAERTDKQVDLMCQALIPALGEAPPAEIEGVNLPADLVKSTLDRASSLGRDAVVTALGRLGLQPAQAEVLAASTRHDESAMAVVWLIDHDIEQTVHPRVVTVADSDYGRVTITASVAADGKRWLSIFPTSPGALRDDLAELLSAPRSAA